MKNAVKLSREVFEEAMAYAVGAKPNFAKYTASLKEFARIKRNWESAPSKKLDDIADMGFALGVVSCATAIVHLRDSIDEAKK